MQLDPNFNELLGSLLAHEVRFLVVGGYAVAAHGHPRYTGDLDVWLLTEPANANALIAALEDFGFGQVGLTRDDFLAPDRVVQLGYPPLRVDLHTGLDGVAFEDCWQRRIHIDLSGLGVPFISLADLRANKRATGRAQDLADLEALDDP